MKLFCVLRRVLVPAISYLIATASPFVSLYILAQTPAITTAPVITTIAGNGMFGYGGDGGPATSAELSLPFQIAVDSAGDIFIADSVNNRVRKTSASGIISTIAGTGTAGFSGDGGPATSAELNFPTAVAVDAAGNVYISEGENNRIRKINTSGIISTIAGTGTAGFGGDGGLATNAQLNNPVGLHLDTSGDIFVADQVNQRIRKINTSGIISTVAGVGTRGFSGDGSAATSAQLNFPNGVTVDTAGDLYIADTINNRIRKVNTSGIISTIAGDGVEGFGGDGGPATSAAINHPYEVNLDAAGNLYFADSDNNRIRKINTSGVISTIVGDGVQGFGGDSGPATSAEIYSPIGMAVDTTDNIYVSDTFNSRIREVQPIPPFPATSVGQTSSSENVYVEINQPLTISSFSVPQSEGGAQEYAVGAVAGCPMGSPLTAGTICTIPVTFKPAYSGVRGVPLIVTTTTLGEFTFGLTGIGTAAQVAVVPGVISTVAGNGSATPSGDNGPATLAGIPIPEGVARDYAGNTYIATGVGTNPQVRKVDPSGRITTFAGTGASCPGGTNPCGDGGPATSATFVAVEIVAEDSAGNVYISDTFGSKIRKVDGNGIITTVAGNGTNCANSTTPCGDGGPATSANLDYPYGIVVDGNGNLFIADYNGNRIRKVAPNGIITTIAGTGVVGFSGDGGPAINATMTYPLGLALDAAGDLYIADMGNGRVRRVDAVTGVITTVAGGGSSSIIPAAGAPATSVLLSNPVGVAIDASGSFYFSDPGYNGVNKVDAATGTLRRIAGTGSAGFTGDGGPATLAELNYPSGVALDSFGNLYIADYYNNRIREVSAAAAPASFPNTGLGLMSPIQSVVLSNIGNSNLSIGSITATADFLVDPSGTCTGLATLAAGVTCNLAMLFQPQQAGARTGNITVTGDALNQAGSTQRVALTGSGLTVATATSLVLSTADTIAFGTAVILTADVTPYTAGSVTATGTMSFQDGATLLGTVPISSAGAASITVPAFAVGAHSLTAIYAGDTNFTTSTSSSVLLTVNAGTIPVSLISSHNPSSYGQTVTFTATVASAATGTIQFKDGTANLSGPVTLAGGVAAFATSALMQGTHSITASYSGDSSHLAATSDMLVQLITPAILTVTANSITRTFNEPNGTLGYMITGFIGSDTQASSVTGAPTLSTATTTASPAGSYPILIGMGTLSSSDYTFMFMNGTLTVTKATPGAGGISGVVLNSPNNPASRGESVTFTATLPANATGQVTFMDGPTVLGTGTIIDEIASFATTQLAIATHPITAVYGGDTNYNGATSAVLSQVINKSTLTVIANDAQRVYGQPNPTFTATITGFVDGDTPAVVTGSPSLTTAATSTSPTGPYPIIAAQGTLAAANYNFAFVNGALNITPAAPGSGPTAPVVIAPSLNPVPLGTPLTFTMTVPAGATGTVNFLDGMTSLGISPVIGNIALLTVSTLSLGTHTITGVYSGDVNFTSASATLSEVVVSPADFTVASSTGRQLIPPGASANFSIVVSSMNLPFTNVVTMSASNLPPGATYTFSPAVVTPGAAGANSTFTITVPPQSSMDSRGRRLGPVAFALLLLPFACLKRHRRSPQRLLLWMLVALASLGAMSGCGQGGYFSQTERTYTITIIGTSGNLVRSTTVTLTVE